VGGEDGTGEGEVKQREKELKSGVERRAGYSMTKERMMLEKPSIPVAKRIGNH